MNEISCVYDISEQNIRRLEEFSKKLMELGATPGSRMWEPDEFERLIEIIKADHEHLPQLLEDLKSSLDVVRREALMFWQHS